MTCLERLLAQTRRPERVVVADNGSADDTAAALDEAGRARPEVMVEVLRLPENLGNAGGVEAAMARAFGTGADAVWILDDDSWPQPGALEALLAHGWDDHVVRLCLQLRPGERRFTWPLDLPDGRGGWRTFESLDDLPAGPVLESRGGWTGALIPRRVREAVGPIESGLFIRGEDEDYPRRITSAGCRFELVAGARLDHPGPDQFIRWRLLGRKLYLEPGLAEPKLYYKVRNMVWIKRREGGLPAALAIAAAYALGLARHDQMSRQRWRTVATAVRHGLQGKLGRR